MAAGKEVVPHEAQHGGAVLGGVPVLARHRARAPRLHPQQQRREREAASRRLLTSGWWEHMHGVHSVHSAAQCSDHFCRNTRRRLPPPLALACCRWLSSAVESMPTTGMGWAALYRTLVVLTERSTK